MEEEDFFEEQDIYIEESSNSSYSEELKNVGDIILRGEKYNIFLKAIETKTPFKFIFQINGELVSVIEKIKNNSTILENYNYFFLNNFKIFPSDFIMLFYIANKEKDKKYLIDNFNLMRNLAGKEEYLIEFFKDYSSKFEEYYNILMEKTKKDFENFDEFYKKIDGIKPREKYDDIIDTFKIEITESVFKITDGDTSIEKYNSRIVFDNMEASDQFPFFRLNIDNKTYYKIYTASDNYDNYIEMNKNFDEDNSIFIIYNIKLGNKYYRKDLVINLETSTIRIKYPENYLPEIKNKLKNIIKNLVFKEEEDKNIIGNFEITFDDYDELKIYYLTLFDDVISNFLFVREKSKPRSLKDNIKFYYVGTEKKREYLNYSLYFNIIKLYGNKYLIKFTSKEFSPYIIKEFIIVMSKLITHYNKGIDKILQQRLEAIMQPYTGPDGLGLGGKIEKKKETGDMKKKKKIDFLLLKAGDVFAKNTYSRNCPCHKQPIIINKEDVHDWNKYLLNDKKRKVYLFPPEKSDQKVHKNYYVCPDDEYSNFALRENTDFSSDYPVIPCCNLKGSTEKLYEDYDKIRSNPTKYWSSKEKFQGKGVSILKTTSKLLKRDRLGTLPDNINKIFNKVDSKLTVFREGVYSHSKNSFFHSCFKAFEDNYKNNRKFLEGIYWNKFDLYQFIDTYITSNLKNKDLLLNNLRSFVGLKNSGLFPTSGFDRTLDQELFQFKKTEITKIFSDITKSFNSKYFYRYLEIIFLFNIFVFKYDKNTESVSLEIPNCKDYHLREIKEIPSVFILKHTRPDDNDVYEIIRNDKIFEETKSSYLFPIKYTNFMKNYTQSKNKYFITSNPFNEKFEDNNQFFENLLGDMEIRENPYSNINWTFILKDYIIESQMINSSGRTFSITFKYTREDRVTIFVPPSFVLPVKISEEIYPVTKKICTSIFGKKFIQGDKGLWFKINNIKNGVFVPCSDVPETKSNNLVCKNYRIVEQKISKNRVIDNINIAKKNSLILRQLFNWLYLKDQIDIDTWFSKYVQKDKKLKKESLISDYFDIPYKFPQNIDSVGDGIIYLNNYIPVLFDRKILLYEELYETMKTHMKNILRTYGNYEIFSYNNKFITGVLINEADFKLKDFNKVIVGDTKYKLWKKQVLGKYQNSLTFDEDSIYNSEFFSVWKNNINNRTYVIQNNKVRNLTYSIYGCMIWNLFKIRLSYNFYDYDIWNLISSTEENIDIVLEYFGLDLEKLKNIIKNKFSNIIHFDSSKEYVNFLYSNKISFELSKEVSYIIYENKNKNVKITTKNIIDQNKPLEILKYNEGGYASMLML